MPCAKLTVGKPAVVKPVLGLGALLLLFLVLAALTKRKK